jgi:hypothetical protein
MSSQFDAARAIDVAQGKAEVIMTPRRLPTLWEIAERNKHWLSEDEYQALLHGAEQLRNLTNSDS